MDIRAVVARNVANHHKSYVNEFLCGVNRQKPTDLFSAFRFFFGISLYQGRRDTISDRFHLILMNVIPSLDYDPLPVFEFTKYQQSNQSKVFFNSNFSDLLSKLKAAGLNKENDRIMTVNVLAIAHHINIKYQQNIIDYIVTEIKKGNIDSVNSMLTNIYSIGPKIAGLLLRDIIQIYELQEFVDTFEKYSLLQPIDTWVHQVSREIGIVSRAKPYKGEGADIVRFCLANDINPIHYNEGAWYVGSQSYRIVLKQLQPGGLV